MAEIATVLLAAGAGKRMGMSKPKVLNEVCGVPMLKIVTDLARTLSPSVFAAVVSDGLREPTREILGEDVKCVIQKERLGTGHAALCSKEVLKGFSGKVVILFADTPLLRTETLHELIALPSKVSIVAFNVDDTTSRYGRVVLNEDGLVDRIVEFADASGEKRSLDLCNSGVMCVDSDVLFDLLEKVDESKASGEYYLTDLVHLARGVGMEVGHIVCSQEEAVGVNSCRDLSRCSELMRNRIVGDLMDSGVVFEDCKSVYVCLGTSIGSGTVIESNVYIGPSVKIGSGCRIRAFSYLHGCAISDSAEIGPFARIRPHSSIEEGAVVGNFVEIKNSNLGRNVRAKHLSYIGDVDCGMNTHIGAGSVFCNYDGFKKFRSVVDEGVIVGANAVVMSPVEIGKGSMLAAGSVITDDVPEDCIAISRAEQRVLGGAAKRYRRRRSSNGD